MAGSGDQTQPVTDTHASAEIFDEILDFLDRERHGNPPDRARVDQRFTFWVFEIMKVLQHITGAEFGCHVLRTTSEGAAERTFISSQGMEPFKASPQFEQYTRAISEWFSDSQAHAILAAKYTGLPLIDPRLRVDIIPSELSDLIQQYRAHKIPMFAERILMHQSLGPPSPADGYWNPAGCHDKCPHMPTRPLEPSNILSYINDPLPAGFLDGRDSQYEVYSYARMYRWSDSCPFRDLATNVDIGGSAGVVNALFLIIRTLVDCDRVQAEIETGESSLPLPVVDAARYYIDSSIDRFMTSLETSNNALRPSFEERKVQQGQMLEFHTFLDPDKSAVAPRLTPLPSPTIGASQTELDIPMEDLSTKACGEPRSAVSEASPIDVSSDEAEQGTVTPPRMHQARVKQEPGAATQALDTPLSPRRISSVPEL